MNLEKAFHTLCDSGVDFVVIGGVAAVLHGSAYVTFDLDICYSRVAANLKRLKDALSPFHPRSRGFPSYLPFVWDEATLRNNSVLTLQTDIGDLDLLADVAGLGGYDAVKDRSEVVTAFDRHITVVDIRGLIQSKRAAGRAKDLSIIPELEGLMEAEEAR